MMVVRLPLSGSSSAKRLHKTASLEKRGRAIAQRQGTCLAGRRKSQVQVPASCQRFPHGRPCACIDYVMTEKSLPPFICILHLAIVMHIFQFFPFCRSSEFFPPILSSPVRQAGMREQLAQGSPKVSGNLNPSGPSYT